MLAAMGAFVLAIAWTEAWIDLSAWSVVVWCLFCALANVLPLPLSQTIYLSLSSTANIAIAFMFEPPVAATIVFSSSLSTWELQRTTPPLHAAFNRAQLGLATAGSSALFHAVDVDVPPAWLAVVAVLAYLGTNLGLVTAAERAYRGTPVRQVLRRLMPASPGHVISFLTMGLVGVALALTYERLGAWAVVLLTLPLFAARHALSMTVELERTERERRMLSDRLVDERERERVRIASQLHDRVLQQMAAVQIEADNVVAALQAGEEVGASARARIAREGAGNAIADLRRAIANLRSPATDADLGAGIRRYGRSFAAESGIDVDLDVNDMFGDVPVPLRILIDDACQELLTNVARHANASRVVVSLRRDGGTLELRVADDGVGITHPVASGRLGLNLTRDKVALSGGAMHVDSAPGKGTTVALRIPLPVQP